MDKILIVEDSAETQRIMKSLLGQSYELHFATSLNEARRHLMRLEPDLILLDLGLPDGSGFHFLAEMSAGESSTPAIVFVVSGNQEESDKLQGFQLGAQDYITKPFSPAELKARIDAHLRRRSLTAPGSSLTSGNLQLDLTTQRVRIRAPSSRQLSIDLSALEFRLLAFFMKNTNRVLTRQQVMEAVWGNQVQVLDRTVDVHVSRLRKKLLNSDFNIATIVGAGYSFRGHSDREPSAA